MRSFTSPYGEACDRQEAGAFCRKVLHVLLGIVLLAAACLKGEEFATGFYLNPPLPSRYFLFLLIQAELLLAVWLLTGPIHKMCWRLVLITFGFFALFSLNTALHGQNSCGCFGRVPINPWYTALLDLAAVLALAIFRPTNVHAKSPCRKWRQMLLIATGILGSGLLAAAAAQSKPADLGDGGVITGPGLVLLDPQSWVGKPLPILPYIDIEEDLSVGSWILVLVHDDCPKCREVLPRYENLAREWMLRGDAARIALISLPSTRSRDQSAVVEHRTICRRGRLSEQRQWFAETPTQLKVVDGLVFEVNLKAGL